MFEKLATFKFLHDYDKNLNLTFSLKHKLKILFRPTNEHVYLTGMLCGWAKQVSPSAAHRP
jgi:hypothetical protein